MSNPYQVPNALDSAAEQALNVTVPTATMPQSSEHRIALIGCGAIGTMQLYAYKQAGWNVISICNLDVNVAEEARDKYFPDAEVTADYRSVLQRGDVTVVDLALHLDIRPGIVREALLAGKHVMSQKPFVEHLDEGVELAQLAERQGRLLAVNQNGRWAPHFRALRHVVDSGMLGTVSAADFSCYWSHDAILADHVLGRDPNLVLYDFAIHWFDLVAGLFADRTARSVYAITGSREGQLVPVPTMASVIIEFDGAQVSINMRASARAEDSGYYHVSGSSGSVRMKGHSLGGESVEITTDEGSASVSISPEWFPDALIGSMADLLCSIETGRRPYAHPRSSLSGLSLCFAAMESAATGHPVDPASVSSRPGAS